MARSYTDDQRSTALELYRERGPAEAARQVGVPYSTVRKWAERASVTGPRAEDTQAAVHAARLTAEERRQRLADGLLEDAERLRQRLFAEYLVFTTHEGEVVTGTLPEPPAADKQRLLVALGIAVDKAQLLAGEVTERRETIRPEVVEAELERLAAEVRDRAEQHDGN